ncbi:uncharacterized protein L969DRAFT_94997 [Mixia osmundae IAM 14324]|uniref:Uncharacterized protein n=1 Tax=Mixia osmundae (strain CBS 9802 / IAM 14324 / JCM 22182 / KY 12970) TaxID=764103 RepID=G7E128_MIXOS|nr:uncharacterized protein L969DRAFT_94997 [Mixia osmundae IAM 14324]KEI38826.1 hypothetical protein L969DRAFT_94997 [Mixia osmundae IAM 14324]GAA96538.1 hypothetical protein E5Q_03206 [Mixia osmundae IAM 14324]
MSLYERSGLRRQQPDDGMEPDELSQKRQRHAASVHPSKEPQQIAHAHGLDESLQLADLYALVRQLQQKQDQHDFERRRDIRVFIQPQAINDLCLLAYQRSQPRLYPTPSLTELRAHLADLALVTGAEPHRTTLAFLRDRVQATENRMSTNMSISSLARLCLQCERIDGLYRGTAPVATQAVLAWVLGDVEYAQVKSSVDDL